MDTATMAERLLQAGLELLSDPLPQAPPPFMAVGMLASCKPSDGRRDAWVDGMAWSDDWPVERTAELVRRANAGWFDLARETHLFGPRGEFLFAVPRGEESSGWRVVRLLDGWDLVGKAAGAGWGSRPGCPEMGMASWDGTVAMLITTYETGVSSIVLPRPWQSQTIRTHMERIAQDATVPSHRQLMPDFYVEGVEEWPAYVQHHGG